MALGIPAYLVTKELLDRYRVNPESAKREAEKIKAKIVADQPAAAKKTAPAKKAAARKAAAEKATRDAKAAKLVDKQKARTVKKRFPAQKYDPKITEGMSRSIEEILNSVEAKNKKNGKDRPDAKKPGWLPWDWIKKSGPDTSAPAKRVYIAPFGEVTVGEDPEETARKEREYEEMTQRKRGGQVRKGPKKTKARRVKTKPLTLKQRSALKQHSQKHTSKHMTYMRDRMKQGDTFKDAHRKATRRVGR